jgi:ABC-type nitrate/sulfonate/bicarbonate transport system substrate-binding protein
VVGGRCCRAQNMNRVDTRNRVWNLPTAVLGVVAVVAFVRGHLGTRHRSQAPAAPLKELTHATPTSLPHTALLQMALAKGYFADEGPDLPVRPVIYGKAAIDLLLQYKQADLATATDLPFVLQILAGQPRAIAASVASVSNKNAIVARRDRSIADAGKAHAFETVPTGNRPSLGAGAGAGAGAGGGGGDMVISVTRALFRPWSCTTPKCGILGS